MEPEPKNFFERPDVKVETIPVGPGVPFGIESVTSPVTGMGGAYGTWGKPFDNQEILQFVEELTGTPVPDEFKMNLAELGFTSRHHALELSPEEYHRLEVEVGARLLRQAAAANGWEPGEVEGVLIGSSAPTTADYLEEIAAAAGIPEQAVKVSVHKACDGSVGALNLALNPDLVESSRWLNIQPRNLAMELFGKKLLVGGIEGLSRFARQSRDFFALQLFANAGGVIGLIPGKTMKFLAGRTREVFDEEGMLQVRMVYPHTHHKVEGEPLVEVSATGRNHLHFSGLMHEPEGDESVSMAGPMGMVKLFVRSGVQVVHEAYGAYRALMDRLGTPHQDVVVAIVHHANYKINQLMAKNLQKEGVHLEMPWLLRDFGNVSAASNMIAYLRKLPDLKPGDHVLIDGFGAGTYYDVLAVELG